MSDAGPPPSDSQEAPAVAVPKTAAAKMKPRMMQDPIVRRLIYVAVGLIVASLVMVLGVILSGVTAPTGPRTLVENELAVAGEAVRSGKASATQWGDYITALVANGRYGQAQGVLDDAKSSIDDSATAVLAVAEVRLLNAQEDYKASIAVANKAQKDADAAYKRALGAGGQKALTAKLDGLPEEWFVLALLKADAYKALGDWKMVLKELDVYITEYPQAADILIDRGNAKVELKDNAGAEKDFRKALRFVPDDKEALAGLKKIGADADE